MLRTYDLRQKEVINVRTAEKLGFIKDVDINFETGKVDAVIVPKKRRFPGVFLSEKEYEILWSDIIKIGREVVLVDYGEYFEAET